jgi:hypothetical protein
MHAMLKPSLALLLLLSVAYSVACENHQPMSGKPLEKTNWKLSTYNCPYGCSDILKNILEKQLGTTIDFKGTAPWVSGTFDACHKPIEIKTKTINIHLLMKEINGALPPLQAISPRELNLQTKNPLIADVLCLGNENQKISHRFIQDDAGRLIAIDEETSILIYE